MFFNKSDYIVSGAPWVVNSTASSIRAHYFCDTNSKEYNTNHISISNTGLSGTLRIAFVSGGFDTGNCFSISAGTTFAETLAISKIYISGSSEQPYIISACITTDNRIEQNTFVPTDISNCYAWWKPDFGITLTGSNIVSSWVDCVNAHEVTASISTGPTYVSSNSTFNNKSTLTFPTNKQLISTEPAINWNFLLSNVGSTIVYCALQTVDTSAVVGLGFPLIGGVTSRCIFLQQDAKNKTEQRFTYSGSATDYGVQNIVGYVTNMPVWGAHALNNTTLTGKTSGSPFTTTAHSVVLGEAGPATTLQIGSNGTFTFNGGTIAEIIIYNKTLTNVEMNNIGTYFVKKYGACV